MSCRAATSPFQRSANGTGRVALVVLALTIAPATMSSCTREGPVVFDVGTVRVSEAEVAAHPSFGLGAEGLRSLVGAALIESGRFRIAPKSSREAGLGATVSLRLGDAAVLAGPPEDPTRRAAVTLELVLTGEKRREATGAGEAPFAPGNPDARGAAFQTALRLALSDAVAALVALADNEVAPDAALVAALGDPDPARRELALRVLVERKAQAAVAPLLARLADPAPGEVLRAAAALAAIGDERAAPALIDAASRRDGEFVARIATALGDLGGPDAEAYLFTAAGGHPDATVRVAATDALATLRENRRRQAEAPPNGIP